MKLSPTLITLAAVAAATTMAAPAFAGWPSPPSHNPPPPPSHDPTPVPEPSDAILLLMGVTGVVIGRKLHARAQKKA